MNVAFGFDEAHGVIVATVHGPMTIEQMFDAAEKSWQRVEGPRIRILWDLRGARFDLSTEEVRELASFAKRRSPPDDLRTAFVVSQDLEFGLVRMFEVFRETPRARARAFRDVESAMKWLADDGAADGMGGPAEPPLRRGEG